MDIFSQFQKYIIRLFQYVPTDVYEGLLSLFCLGTLFFIAIWGWEQGWRKALQLLLLEYIFLIYCSTVFFRKVTEGVEEYNFNPFWSYEAIQNGRQDLIAENVMNVIVFIPIGMVLGSLLRGKGSWMIMLVVGLCISCSIEMLQYFLKRGFAEVDDVIHNTIGCIIGYILVQGSRLMIYGYGNR